MKSFSMLTLVNSVLLFISIASARSSFDIVSQTTAAYRDEYCRVQTAYCQSFCGVPSNVKINFCSPCAMKWNCECANPTQSTYPNAPDSVFPLQYYQCVGEKSQCLADCQTKFGVQTAATDLCKFSECEAKFICGSATGGEKVSLRINGSEFKCLTTGGGDGDDINVGSTIQSGAMKQLLISAGTLIASVIINLLP